MENRNQSPNPQSQSPQRPQGKLGEMSPTKKDEISVQRSSEQDEAFEADQSDDKAAWQQDESSQSDQTGGKAKPQSGQNTAKGSTRQSTSDQSQKN